MEQSLRNQSIVLPHRHGPLKAVHLLLCTLLAITMAGLCLVQDLQAAQTESNAIGCHGDRWYQRPALQPVALRPQVPDLPLPPIQYDAFEALDMIDLTAGGQHGAPLPSRSPPMPVSHPHAA